MFDFLTPSSAPIATRSEAVVEGFGAAVARVLLSFGLPAACIYLTLLYEQILQWLGPVLGLYNDGHFDSGTALVVVPLVAGCLIWSVFLIWTDAEDKWRTLNWLYFAMFSISLTCTYGPAVLFPIVLLAHAGFHWSIHEAMRVRAETYADGEETVPVPERESSPRPDLLNQYGGVSGFPGEEKNPVRDPEDSGRWIHPRPRDPDILHDENSKSRGAAKRE